MKWNFIQIISITNKTGDYIQGRSQDFILGVLKTCLGVQRKPKMPKISQKFWGCIAPMCTPVATPLTTYIEPLFSLCFRKVDIFICNVTTSYLQWACNHIEIHYSCLDATGTQFPVFHNTVDLCVLILYCVPYG